MSAVVTPMSFRPPIDGTSVDPVVLSIVISTYDAGDVLAGCLRSIYDNPPGVPYEIIVVDDASSDGTSAMVSSRFPEVVLLHNETNCRYSVSNNRALDLARGRLVLLLNNDTIVMADALDQMIAFLNAHPDAGAVGCRLLNADGTIQWSVRSLPDLGAALFGGRSVLTRLFPNNPFSRKRLLHGDHDTTEPFVAGYISGACKMMPRKVIEQVGQLDERFFYHVDADYCKRIAAAGYKCYCLPTTSIVHLDHKGGSMVSSTARFRSLLSFHIDCYIYYRKHLQRSVWSPMHIGVLVALAVHCMTMLGAQVTMELGRSLQSIARHKVRVG